MTVISCNDGRKFEKGGAHLGYSIKYEDRMIREFLPEKSKQRLPVGLITMVALCLVLLFTILGNMNTIKNQLMPGNAKVTQSALEDMVQSITEGEQVKDAFAAFCVDIIDNADIY